MILKPLLIKEFLQFRRNMFLPRLVFMFPIVVMCVLPWVMDMEVRNIAIVAVDNDRSMLSQRLVHRLESSDYFVFKGLRGTNAEAIEEVERGRADVVLTVPRHFERDVTTGRSPQLLVSANAVNGTKGSIGASYVGGIIKNAMLSEPLAGVNVVKTDGNRGISELYLYNKNLDYKVFMIPALMSILVMMLCGFLPALNIVSEKESGTIEQINVSPVSRGAFIVAKLVPYWLIGMLVLTVCFVLSWAVYGIVPAGSLPLLYLLAMLMALVFSGFGLIISNYSDTMQQAMFVMWFFVVCMMLLSGLFTPVRSMPEWAQTLTLIDPVRYFIDAMRTVFVRGGTFSSVCHEAVVLTVMACIANAWAIKSYRKRN